MKVVVNSCVTHGNALAQLLLSVRQSDFPASDLIVVVGGADECAEPLRTREGHVQIQCTKQAFDFHGFTCLFQYKNHPLVTADGYLYIHDTCIAKSDIAKRLAALDFSNPCVIYGPPLPAANMCAFGYGVLERIGATYDIPISKSEAMRIERGMSSIPHPYRFGSLQLLPARRRVGECDPYTDGQRISFYYDSFGVYKYVTANPLTKARQ